MKKKRFVSLLAVIALVSSILCIVGRNDKKIFAYDGSSNVARFDREIINFNREWRFVRDDIDGAEGVTFNDSSWYNVGLPHDFSIPYWQEEKHYTGYGWYRKNFVVTNEWMDKHVTLDFAGVFHTAEVYINGELAGSHEGGYTGFEIDISDYIHTGNNIVAVRVNNIWKATLAPRAGEHMFTGGIYRDVNLIISSPVHVAWYGTFVQTPDISAERSKVRVITEVTNDSSTTQTVNVVNTIYDQDNTQVAVISSPSKTINAGDKAEFDDTSSYINNPKLWSPENPNLYSVHTDVQINGSSVDQYDTTFGFRWFKFDPNEGFFLNGKHYWIDGINAHQDHAGWANAVTTRALYRDVEMIKESGLNFIRGSHYPHSPAYGDACDKLGILFWSEAPFWCTSAWGEGTQNGTSEDYKVDGYPSNGNKANEEAFEQSCVDSLSEMIHINRNHPSIIVWSMGNEPFFGDNHEKKKLLISKMAGVAKKLDPTRPTAIGGTQRGSFDHLPNVDIAGYNGDGADMPEYQNPGVGNLVSEYSSHSANRPDKYSIFYGSVQTDSSGEAIRYPWRSGVALWCAFHHGSILSRSYGDMGYIDYYRLPLNIWYYYRKTRTGVEPEFSKNGTPARLKLTASDTTIKNDGTSDSHIIVTVTDKDGNWLNNEPEVTFEITDGPGIFPTGKSITFKPGNNMRDGKAAIEFRSYYAGTTTIRAYSNTDPDIEPATITITTTGKGSVDEPAIETMYGAFMSNGGYVPNSIDEPTAYRYHRMTGCPMNASSGLSTVPNIQDGYTATSWQADSAGSNQWVYMEIEHGGMSLYKARLEFEGKAYPYKIQYKTLNLSEDEWVTLKEYDSNSISSRPYEEDLGGKYMRYIRILFTDVPDNEYANLAELRLYGLRAVTTGYRTGIKKLDDVNVSMSNGSFEYTCDLEHDNPDYARFICNISPDESEVMSDKVKYAVYCDEELVYEKTASDTDDICNIDISVNKVKKLKITATSSDNVNLKISNIRLMGAYRDITRSTAGTDNPVTGNELINTQVCCSMDTLEPGKELNLQARITNKSDARTSLTYAALLYKADGTLAGTSLSGTSVPGHGQTIMDMSINIPASTGKFDIIKFIGWNTNTLVPVTDLMYICENGTSTGEGIIVDTDIAKVLAAFDKAMQIIYAGNADIFSTESKTGFTDALLFADNTLKESATRDYATAISKLTSVVNALLPATDTDSNPSNNGKTNNSNINNNNNSNGASNTNNSTNSKKLTKGKRYKAGKFRYKVLKVTKKSAKVTLYRPVSKKIKTARIPTAVKIKGIKCKVTAIAPKAFIKCKKLKKLIIGRNIKKIGKKAIPKTKNLKKIVNKSKVKIK